MPLMAPHACGRVPRRRVSRREVVRLLGHRCINSPFPKLFQSLTFSFPCHSLQTREERRGRGSRTLRSTLHLLPFVVLLRSRHIILFSAGAACHLFRYYRLTRSILQDESVGAIIGDGGEVVAACGEGLPSTQGWCGVQSCHRQAIFAAVTGGGDTLHRLPRAWI